MVFVTTGVSEKFPVASVKTLWATFERSIPFLSCALRLDFKRNLHIESKGCWTAVFLFVVHTQNEQDKVCVFWRIFDKNNVDLLFSAVYFHKEHRRSVVADKVSYFWVIFHVKSTNIQEDYAVL